jgi:MarR family 2-MHQ and catechol resistance regulon transcriptional repressor
MAFTVGRAESRAMSAFLKLNRAAGTLNSRLATDGMGGLTPGQFAALEALHHLGPLGQGTLARKLMSSASNLSTVLDNLERAGLVTRTRGADDRRHVTVALTEAGKARIEEVFPAQAERVRALMDALRPDEIEELGRLCRKLGLAAARPG